ncbi:uncharacterized protein LOC135472713 [Liolophura sinensis]|uniref:uncharacterized protein LOC135472713 n=1 Tax=Liolophura sinensis TaxID=3198878 RepID=UPI003157F27D
MSEASSSSVESPKGERPPSQGSLPMIIQPSEPGTGIIVASTSSSPNQRASLTLGASPSHGPSDVSGSYSRISQGPIMLEALNSPPVEGLESDPMTTYVRSISHSSNFTVGNITHWHVDRQSNTTGKSEAYVKYCKKEDDLFVETKAYFEAKDMLEKHNVVNILGGSGEGKTALLKHLTLHLAQQEFTPLEITRPEEIEENYTEDKHFLFVCDDPFGGPYLQQDSVNNWVRIGKSLEKYLLSGLVKIAFASRKNIWADCDKCLSDLELFSYRVELASQRLTSQEKRQMLRLHFDEKFPSLSEADIISITELESPIAFPYCCKLVSSCEFKDLSFDRLLDTFRRPFGLLAKELAKMLENSPWKFSVLVVIMLSGGALGCDQFNASDASAVTKDMVDCALDSCGIVEATRPFGQLKKCAESLIGHS